ILRRELDHLLRPDNRNRQTPLELLVARNRRVQPPVTRRQRHRSVSLLIEARVNRRASLHPFLQKIFKPFAFRRLGEELVSHGDDVNRIQAHGDVQRWANTLGRLPDHDLQVRSLLIERGFRTTRRKTSINQPTRADEQENQQSLQRDDHEVAHRAETLQTGNVRTRNHYCFFSPRTKLMSELKMRSSLTLACHSASVRSRA